MAQHFRHLLQKEIMNNRNKDIERNRPADKGRGNDPHIRDNSALQPGASTISKSDTDDVNQHLTKTTSDSYRTEPRDPKADPAFDDIANPDDND
jgi:hypothetical protein